MLSPRRFFVVDDDRFTLKLITLFLQESGHEVDSARSGTEALERIVDFRPDCLLTDIMMPNMDGLELCRQVKAQPELKDLKIIVVTGKNYDFDRRAAKAAGAVGYITKPLQKDAFIESLRKILEDKVVLDYWGVRGTLPVPGPRSLRYGGNTPCVSLSFANDQLFIFDAGTGIKELSRSLLQKGGRISAKLFISHPHWDHINALPFFVPLYIQGNEFEIMGAQHGDLGMKELISAQMEGVFFPITVREFGASIQYRDLHEEKFEIDGIQVETMLLSHPGNCLGYRITYKDRSVCYITDNEIYPPTVPEYNEFYIKGLADFVRETDILIIDTSYTDEAYKSKIGWGHSCVSMVCDLAHRAKVKNLHIMHHEPDESDDDIAHKWELCKKALADLGSETNCIAPAEGERYEI